MTHDHFVYQLIPPRPTFASDMTADEQAIMGEHAAYWSELFDQGRVALFGPVLDPSGAWGLAVVEADRIKTVRELGDGDPAVRSQMCTYDVFAVGSALVRPASSASSIRARS